jgi:hypothetical protein
MKDRICPACGVSTANSLFPLEKTWPGVLLQTEYLLTECSSCGTIFLTPEPPPSDLAIIYGHSQFTSEEYTDTAKIARVIAYYGSRLKTIGETCNWRESVSICEIGAGRAWMCLAAKIALPGSRTVAQDVTDECTLTTPWADRYEVADLAALSGNEQFHLASLTHVIEHLVFPRTTMQLIRARLRDDGLVFVTAPHRPVGFQPRSDNAEVWRAWSYNHVPAHLQYLTREGMERLGTGTIGTRMAKLLKPGCALTPLDRAGRRTKMPPGATLSPT